MEKIEYLLKQNVKNPKVKYYIDRIEIDKQKKPGKSSKILFNIWIKIITNNRPAVIGNYSGMPINGLYGLFTSEMEGYLEGFFDAKNEYSKVKYIFTIDVFEEFESSIKFQDLIEVIPIKNALKNKLIRKGTDIYEEICKYNLKYIVIIGASITSPVPGTLRAVSNFISENPPKTVLDLFSGVGTISKAILTNIKCNIKCVDLYLTSWAMKNLFDFKPFVNFTQTDVYSYTPEHKFDLIIADPFDYMALDFAEHAQKNLSIYCNTLIMTHGFSYNKYWCKKIINELKKGFSKVETIVSNNVNLAICYP